MVTRLYTPEEFGLVTILSAFLGFVIPLSSLRYDSALYIVAERDQGNLFFLTLCSVVAVTLLASLGFHVLISQEVLGYGALPTWSPWACSAILVGFGAFNALRASALRAGHVREVAVATALRPTGQAIARVAFGLSGLGFVGLAMAEIVWAWAGLLRIWGTARAQIGLWRRAVSFSGIQQAASRYRRFALFETPSSIFDGLNLALPVVLVGSLFGLEAASWFAIAHRTAAVPNMQIGRAVADVFQVRLAGHLRAGQRENGRRLALRMVKKLALLGLAPMVALAIFAPLTFSWIFGEQWGNAGLTVTLVAPWLYAGFVYGPLSRTFSVLERQDRKMLCDIFGTLLLSAAYWFSLQHHLTYFQFVALLTAAMLLLHLAYLATLWNVLKNARGL